MKQVNISPGKNESGQIIVILGLAVIALLAFTGLAIDGNRVYHSRRINQSTADSAAMVGAGAAARYLEGQHLVVFDCDTPDNSLSAKASDVAIAAAIQAAKESALADSVVLLPYDLSTNNGVTSVCSSDGVRKYLDVIVKVTTTTPTTFTKVINISSINTSAQATVRIYPRQSAAYGNALVALSKDCGLGIDLTGSIDVKILDGGIFSNSSISGNSQSAKVYVKPPGTVLYNDGCPYTAKVNFTPNPPGPSHDRLAFDIEPPKCSNAAFVNANNASGTLSPGNYNGITVKNAVTLQPGLYCIRGPLNVNANANFTADGVTFYFLPGSSISFNGSAELHLKAPPANATPPAVPGLLMYFDKDLATTITLNGNSLNDYQGTIYAPKSHVKINGDSGSKTMYTQIIAYDIAINGNATLLMDQIGDDQFKFDASLGFLK